MRCSAVGHPHSSWVQLSPTLEALQTLHSIESIVKSLWNVLPGCSSRIAPSKDPQLAFEVVKTSTVRCESMLHFKNLDLQGLLPGRSQPLKWISHVFWVARLNDDKYWQRAFFFASPIFGSTARKKSWKVDRTGPWRENCELLWIRGNQHVALALVWKA